MGLNMGPSFQKKEEKNMGPSGPDLLSSSIVPYLFHSGSFFVILPSHFSFTRWLRRGRCSLFFCYGISDPLPAAVLLQCHSGSRLCCSEVWAARGPKGYATARGGSSERSWRGTQTPNQWLLRGGGTAHGRRSGGATYDEAGGAGAGLSRGGGDGWSSSPAAACLSSSFSRSR
jgi:hypothetical protein